MNNKRQMHLEIESSDDLFNAFTNCPKLFNKMTFTEAKNHDVVGKLLRILVRNKRKNICNQ